MVVVSLSDFIDDKIPYNSWCLQYENHTRYMMLLLVSSNQKQWDAGFKNSNVFDIGRVGERGEGVQCSRCSIMHTIETTIHWKTKNDHDYIYFSPHTILSLVLSLAPYTKLE